MNKACIPLTIMVALAGCLGQTPSSGFTEKMAADIAVDFIEKSPTFRWDGNKDSLSVTEVISLSRCFNCYGVTLAFQCAHGGYGDRSGEMVTQALTPHTSVIVVENGKVTSAIIDEIWDELAQEEVEMSSQEIQTPYDITKCLFIEFWTEKMGKVISGEVPRIAIDFPTYRFDEGAGVLEGLVNFEISDNLIAILGMGTSLSGDAGMGAASMLYDISSLPYAGEDMTIEKISSDGTVHILFRGKRIALAQGEEWKKTEVRIEDVGEGKVEYTITYRIRNYGWLQKSNIKRNPVEIKSLSHAPSPEMRQEALWNSPSLPCL